MTTPAEWLAGARPRTLPAAAAPVIAGTGAAAGMDSLHLGKAVLCLAVALALQVGVNYANDYSDGVRGTDVERVGPMRLTASGAAPAHLVRRAAVISFAVAAVCGLALAWLAGLWWLIAVGAVAIVAAWAYTGGPKPYGYLGLGDLAVFIFFGLVATLGTTYVQAYQLTWMSYLVAIGIGFIACALLMVNNLRDIPTDAVAGKRTLAVRLGERSARGMYLTYVWGAIVLGLACIPAAPWAGLLVLVLPAAVAMSLAIIAGASGRLLLPILGGTGLLELAYAILMAIALAAA